MPNFELWSQENLAKFAVESYKKMQEQQEYIQQLQNDLKDAIAAYRRRHIDGND
jgi:hypothetical protein